jgi:hypothetical protein
VSTEEHDKKPFWRQQVSIQDILLMVIAGSLLWIGHSLVGVKESLVGVEDAVDHIRLIQYDPAKYKTQRWIPKY